MRIGSRRYLKPRHGETRVVVKYLWVPRCFGGSHWRWLEWAGITERVCGNLVDYFIDVEPTRYFWHEVGFADEEDDYSPLWVVDRAKARAEEAVEKDS